MTQKEKKIEVGDIVEIEDSYINYLEYGERGRKKNMKRRKAGITLSKLNDKYIEKQKLRDLIDRIENNGKGDKDKYYELYEELKKLIGEE